MIEWLENPTVAAVLGGIAGALLASIVPVLIWRYTRKTLQVSCHIGDMQSLLDISEKVREKLNVNFDGSPVKDIYFFSIEVSNTGNQALKGQPIFLEFSGDTNIVDYSIKTEPVLGFGKIEEVENRGNYLELRAELMNPGDRIHLEGITTNNIDDSIEVSLKNENVSAYISKGGEGNINLNFLMGDKSLIGIAFLSAIPIVGSTFRPMMDLAIAHRLSKIPKKD